MDTAGNTGTIPRDIPPRPDPVENQLASLPSRPYTGPLRGCSWNAQALFARKTRQHKAKSGHAIRLMGQHDFLAIQETHSDVGRARMLRCGPDVTTFWSHNGSSHTAGVALWLRSSFLQQFEYGTVIVTHDPVDALVLADRIVVLEGGRITQEGPTAVVAREPRTEYLATVLGVTLVRGVARSGVIACDAGGELIASIEIDGTVVAVIRPQAISLHAGIPEGSARNVWRT